MWTMVDHYLTLGVGRGASEREIVRAYRRLARRYHPDVSTAPALEVFLAVQEAYETLSNGGRRASYDLELRRRAQPLPPRTQAAASSARARSKLGVREPRTDETPPDTEASTAALGLVAGSAVALVVAVVLGNVAHGEARFLWAGVWAGLSLIATLYARHLAAHQLETLWRWTADTGRSTLRRSEAAAVAYQRIWLADDLTRLAGRGVLVAIPIVFLLVPR